MTRITWANNSILSSFVFFLKTWHGVYCKLFSYSQNPTQRLMEKNGSHLSFSSLPGIPLSVLSVPMEDKYKCQQCLQVLRKPVQAQCGHRFCVHCFRQLTRYTTSPFDCQKNLFIYFFCFSWTYSTFCVDISVCFSHMTHADSSPHMVDS